MNKLSPNEDGTDWTPTYLPPKHEAWYMCKCGNTGVEYKAYWAGTYWNNCEVTPETESLTTIICHGQEGRRTDKWRYLTKDELKELTSKVT
jgi:hypothetical protein